MSSRLLGSGESSIASLGLLAAMIVLVVMGGLAFGTRRIVLRSIEQDRLGRASEVASGLGDVLGEMLDADRLTPMRRLVQNAEVDEGIGRVRVLLGDGRVLASGDTSEISLDAIPEDIPAVDPGVAGRGLVVATGSGEMVIEVVPARVFSSEMSRTLQAALGIGCAALLVGLWGVYHLLRRRLVVMGTIGDAVLASGDGRASPQALRVSESLGPLASGWNTLLDDWQALRERAVRERAGEALAGSGGAGSDARDACDALWQGVVVLGEDGRVRYANAAGAMMLARTSEQIVGLAFDEAIEDDALRSTIQSVLDGRVKRRVSSDLSRRGDREDVLRFTVHPLRTVDGGAVMIVIEDVTQQRVASRATGGFLAQATHELRTPLTNIRLYTEEAIDLNEDDARERSRCLDVINQEVRRLERLVGDILSVSEIESGAMSLRVADVRLERVVESLRNEYEAQAMEKSLTLKIEAPPKYPVFGGDRDKLAMAMHNLLGNAIKYTPERGRVEVRVQADERELRFEVRDTGIGIGEEDQQHVFEAFFRSDEARGEGFTGTGMGLAIAQEIARLHGGEITLESEVAQGSTFTLRVPNAPLSDRAVAA